MTKSMGSPFGAGLLLTPRTPSTAVEGAAVGLGQDVLHIMLGVDQADRAVRLAVAILPGVDHELAISHLHPAETLLVQDSAVHFAGGLVPQRQIAGGCGDVSGLHERGARRGCGPSASRQCLTGWSR